MQNVYTVQREEKCRSNHQMIPEHFKVLQLSWQSSKVSKDECAE